MTLVEFGDPALGLPDRRSYAAAIRRMSSRSIA